MGDAVAPTIAVEFAAHQGSVLALLPLPWGANLLASCGTDKVVKVWDVATAAQPPYSPLLILGSAQNTDPNAGGTCTAPTMTFAWAHLNAPNPRLWGSQRADTVQLLLLFCLVTAYSPPSRLLLLQDTRTVLRAWFFSLVPSWRAAAVTTLLWYGHAQG